MAARAWLCRCEDVDQHEVEEAIREGFSDLESLRRYTAVGTGPCQGKACIAETIRLLARHHGVAEAAIGQATLRPPHVPVPLGALAAIDPQVLEGLLDDKEAEAARAARSAHENAPTPRTGRPTPASVERSLDMHRALTRERMGRPARSDDDQENKDA